jgi:potassium-transporting ATPase KdpC subunit
MFLQQLRPALVILALLTLLTGIAYPLAVTAVAQVAFPWQANGSLVSVDGRVVGSALIGQANADARYFWPRPSAIDYNPLPSGGSNWGPTSAALQKAAADRAAQLRATYHLAADVPLPPDLIFASGSGLDPHISPEAARLQIDRVAQARQFTTAQRAALAALVEQSIEPPQAGLWGQPRVNVLLLNLAVDGLK